jgi:hypothetical protein
MGRARHHAGSARNTAAGDNHASIVTGLAKTGRIVTAAALGGARRLHARVGLDETGATLSIASPEAPVGREPGPVPERIS